jgi:uncharacterized protein (TIGR03083 family)
VPAAIIRRHAPLLETCQGGLMSDDPAKLTLPGAAWSDSGTKPLTAARVPPIVHAQARVMALIELERFLDLLQELAPADWLKPTACTLWNVRQIVAHVAGAAAYASWPQLARQWNPLAQRPYRQAGLTMLDALNQIQVDDRASSRPDDLIAELRLVGPRAIATRHRQPAPVRALRLPMPALGVAPIGYLTDVIYTRDMWIHRLDIARATRRAMALSPDHDGRIIALAARDLSTTLDPILRGADAIYGLTGPAGGRFRFGANDHPAVTIRIDALDFAWLAAGRLTPEQARETVAIAGEWSIADRVLGATAVPI